MGDMDWIPPRRIAARPASSHCKISWTLHHARFPHCASFTFAPSYQPSLTCDCGVVGSWSGATPSEREVDTYLPLDSCTDGVVALQIRRLHSRASHDSAAGGMEPSSQQHPHLSPPHLARRCNVRDGAASRPSTTGKMPPLTVDDAHKCRDRSVGLCICRQRPSQVSAWRS